MKISEYVNSAWSMHATEPAKVLEEVKHQFAHIENEDEILSLANLIVHVAGEHLGQWLVGLELLKKLKNNPMLKNRQDMARMVAVLELGNNSATSIEKFSPSEQARILAQTASALASLGGIKLSESYLERAEKLVSGLEASDPANKSLAITGNNVASSLEEKKDRTESQTALMLKAAKLGRVYWAIAGTWKETERAEYRLAKSHLSAGLNNEALEHSKKCLEIVAKNNNEALELFFGLEVLAFAHKALGNAAEANTAVEKMKATFNLLSSDEQSWCKSTLAAM
jgi:tetratricopeptide (TPR) repeat protein